MVEPIRELRAICQSKNEEERGYLKIVARRVSIYITKLLLYTPITGNQATLLYILSGLIAGIFFIPGNTWCTIVGAFLLQLWFVMDCVDGEVARYRKTSSLTGVYLDVLSHHIVHPYIFACVSFGIYNSLHDMKALIFGFLVVLSMNLLAAVQDCRPKAIFDNFRRGYFFVGEEIPLERTGDSNTLLSKDWPGKGSWDTSIPRRMAKKLGLLVLYRLDFLYGAPAFSNIITVAALTDWLVPDVSIGSITVSNIYAVLIAYALVLPIVFVGTAYFAVRNRATEWEYGVLSYWLKESLRKNEHG